LYAPIDAQDHPERSHRWRGVGIGVVAVVVVFALLLGGVYALGQQRAEQSEQSTYEYQVTVATNQTLTNATFYVPVPESNGDAELGEQFVEDVQYSRETPSIRGYDDTPARVNFTYELVDTEHGRMLAISADRIEVQRAYYREVENETMGWREPIPESQYDPSNPSMGVVDDGTFTFSVTATSEETIDTAEPFGTEPLLTPQFNRTQMECRYGQQERHRCFEYDTRVYATYGAPRTRRCTSPRNSTVATNGSPASGRATNTASGPTRNCWARAEAGTSCRVNWRSEAAVIGTNSATGGR
jgi:hypothetical protein